MARRTPARHKSGPKRGQFKSTRRNPPVRARRAKAPKTRKRGSRVGTKRPAHRKGSARATAARGRSSAARRRARRNSPKYLNKAMMQIALWSAAATVGQRMLAKAGWLSALGVFGAFVPVLAVGGAGVYMARKEKSRPAGYALIGIAAGQLASVAIEMWWPDNAEGGSTWAPRSALVQRLPQRVTVPYRSPVSSIVVPA